MKLVIEIDIEEVSATPEVPNQLVEAVALAQTALVQLAAWSVLVNPVEQHYPRQILDTQLNPVGTIQLVP